MCTHEDLENLYVLEAAKSRVVVLTKTGAFVKQLEAKEIAVATDLVVSSDAKTVYLSAGSVVYSFSLE